MKLETDILTLKYIITKTIFIILLDILLSKIEKIKILFIEWYISATQLLYLFKKAIIFYLKYKP